MKLSECWDYYERVMSQEGSGKESRQISILNEMIQEHQASDVYWAIRFFVRNPLEDPDDDMGVGKKSMRKAATRVFDADYSDVREAEKEEGYLSLGIGELDRPNSLTGEPKDIYVSDLANRVETVAHLRGENDKIKKISQMFNEFTEPQLVSHAILADVKFGAGVKTLFKLLRQEYDVTRDELDRAHGLRPNIADIVQRLKLGHGLLTELEPMMRTKTMRASSKSLPDDTSEWIGQTKYDGGRLLIHCRYEDGQHNLAAYTRGRNAVGGNFPELAKVGWPSTDFIVDAEAVGYDADTGEPVPFQNFMERFQREKAIEEKMEEIEIEFKLFDLLYFDDEDLTQRPYDTRWGLLRKHFPPPNLAQGYSDLEEAFETAVEAGHEGIIAKHWDHTYDFERSTDWRKVKPTKDNVELRVCGVKRGTGKFNNTLGALYVETEDGVKMGKVGTGFSDLDRDELWELHVQDGIQLVGREIVEIEWEELQQNGDSYGLRFPRFVRRRPDKDEANTLEEVKQK